MTGAIEFMKLSGSGNDFVCMDNRDNRFEHMLASPQRAARFARMLCRRSMGVGGDGVIFACPCEIPEKADLQARFFEADGSEAELCGNGAACFAAWTMAEGWATGTEVKILTSAGIVIARKADGDYVRVCIPLPRDIRQGLELDVKGSRWTCDYVVTGVPHVVTIVRNIEHLDVMHWGPGFRYHDRFAPRGVNANFVQVLGEGDIAVRTYEFGVENETQACGTGSAASAILMALRLGWTGPYINGDRPVLVHVRSGDVLRVYLTLSGGSVTDLCLETVVRFAFRGTVHPDLALAARGG